MYVYVIGPSSGPYKVGRGRCAESRRRLLQTGNHLPLSVVYLRKVENPAGIEKRAHQLLSAHHINGEWFDVQPDDAISALRSAIAECGVDLGGDDEAIGVKAAVEAQRRARSKREDNGLRSLTVWLTAESQTALAYLGAIYSSNGKAISAAILSYTPEMMERENTPGTKYAVVNAAIMNLYRERKACQ